MVSDYQFYNYIGRVYLDDGEESEDEWFDDEDWENDCYA